MAGELWAEIMDDPEKPASLRELDERLTAVRKRYAAARAPRRAALSSQGMGAGFRIAVEILAALVVGSVMGFLLDDWLGTRPWLMIVFFFVGSGAALRNVVRTAKQLDAERKRQREAGRNGPGA